MKVEGSSKFAQRSSLAIYKQVLQSNLIQLMEKQLVCLHTASDVSKFICCFCLCTAPQDYTATIATFTFSATQSQDCVDVPIIPDNVIEGSESFSGNLDTSAALVTLDPHITEITIIDAGCKSKILS